jgi:hypothetical protein
MEWLFQVRKHLIISYNHIHDFRYQKNICLNLYWHYRLNTISRIIILQTKLPKRTLFTTGVGRRRRRLVLFVFALLVLVQLSLLGYVTYKVETLR